MGQGQVRTIPGYVAELLFTLNPEKLKKLFGGGDDRDDKKDSQRNDDDEGLDTDIESNVDDSMEKGKTAAKKGGKAETDSDGIWRLRCHGR